MDGYRKQSTRRLPIRAAHVKGERWRSAQLSVADTARGDHYARASRADNTWKAYQAAFSQFSAWCEGQGRSPMPADAASLREYVAALADAGRALTTINLHMAAIASAHSVAQQHFDRIKDDIKGIRREHPRTGQTTRRR
jgi:hypothetical protein